MIESDVARVEAIMFGAIGGKLLSESSENKVLKLRRSSS